MRILFIGDIFGRHRPHDCATSTTGVLLRQHAVDLCIANGENAAGGFGLTPAIAEEFFNFGIDVLTTGNHVWDKRELTEYFKPAAKDEPYSPARARTASGKLSRWAAPASEFTKAARARARPTRLSICKARVFMHSIDDPFRGADPPARRRSPPRSSSWTSTPKRHPKRLPSAGYLEGRVTAVIGTHTHIPTADTRLLPGGTAYQTDVGMTGPYDSVIGVVKEQMSAALPHRPAAAL